MAETKWKNRLARVTTQGPHQGQDTASHTLALVYAVDTSGKTSGIAGGAVQVRVRDTPVWVPAVQGAYTAGGQAWVAWDTIANRPVVALGPAYTSAVTVTVPAVQQAASTVTETVTLIPTFVGTYNVTQRSWGYTENGVSEPNVLWCGAAPNGDALTSVALFANLVTNLNATAITQAVFHATLTEAYATANPGYDKVLAVGLCSDGYPPDGQPATINTNYQFSYTLDGAPNGNRGLSLASQDLDALRTGTSAGFVTSTNVPSTYHAAWANPYLTLTFTRKS